ncbi:MAG: NnrU family protein [Pseudomonadaceae bacterium]|nr:NnrU family protein [Pseudomonadaceae bacterium]
MTALIAGLLVFLGIHSLNMLAPALRNRMVDRLGLLGWKGVFALISLIGFGMLVWGYGEARSAPVWLWQSPVWTRHLASLLMLPAMILLVATYVPGTRIKARIGHPMLLATKVWALAHLVANGTLADLILFGAFLAWAVAGFIVFRRRDRASGRQYPVAGLARDIAAIAGGVILWGLFAFHLHRLLIGVAPFGG